MLTVRFEDFWHGFDPEDFFLPLLRRSLGSDLRTEQSDLSPVDISLQSVFPGFPRSIAQRIARKGSRILRTNPPTLRGRAKLKLWFTGENTRPPVDGFDLTLSFDTDTYDGRNLYLPLILTRAAEVERGIHGEGSRLLGDLHEPGSLHATRPTATSQRPGFACLIMSNPEPTRIRMARALSHVGQVDLYGPAVGKPLRTKAEVAHRYRFIICFENAYYPGYVTEKILDAWLLRCVPLWAGFDRAGILNRQAFLNLWDFPDMNTFVERVAELDASAEQIDSITSEGLLNRPLDLTGIEQQIRAAWQRVSG